MNKKLIIFLFGKIISNILGVALILFFCAGTIYYTEGLIFIGAILITAIAYSVVMLKKYPDLFSKRLLYKEKNFVQQTAIVLFLLVCIMMIAAAGLSFRLKLYVLPVYRLVFCAALIICAAILYLKVLKVNAYLTSEITVQDGQTVVEDGPYAVVRHPMYTAMLMFIIAANLYFGSILSLACVILFVPVLILRILNEEKVLSQNLSGYTEYKKKVKYRIIPFLW